MDVVVLQKYTVLDENVKINSRLHSKELKSSDRIQSAKCIQEKPAYRSKLQTTRYQRTK